MTAPATSASAIRFYGELFGWKFAGPGPMPGEPPGRYFVARLRERDVAGVGSLPAEAEPSTAAWYTHVAVADADESAARAGRAGGRILARPIGEPPAGRLAVVADPAGAVFCLWEPERRRGAQLVNEPSAWSMSLLQTTNPSGAETFTPRVFGWRHESFDMGEVELVLWRLPGYVGGKPGQPVPRDVVATMLSLGGNGAGEGRSHWSVDFWIDDADAAAAKATEFGGSVVVPPHDVPGFRSAVLADPHGATFSVSTLRPARPSHDAEAEGVRAPISCSWVSRVGALRIGALEEPEAAAQQHRREVDPKLVQRPASRSWWITLTPPTSGEITP